MVASFIPIYYLKVSSNIMSLGGLALAIGVLVDAGAGIGTLWRFFDRPRITFKKKRRMPLSRNAAT